MKDTNKLTILIVGTDSLDKGYGGGQVYVRNLIEYLIDSGHEVEYLSLTFSNVTTIQFHEQKVNGVNARLLELPALWNEVSTPQFDSAIDALTKVFQEIHPDIIHTHGFKELASLAADRAAIPCVVTAHHGGIVCPAGALLNHSDEICAVPAGQRICLPCCIRNIPGNKLWLTLLQLVPLSAQMNFGQWLRTGRFLYLVTPLATLALSIREKIAATEKLGSYATRLIAPSPAMRDALLRNGIPTRKIVIVPHGIPLLQRKPLPSRLDERPIRFLYVGRICYVKGVHVMLAALSGLPANAYELHIVGGAVTKSERRYLAKLQRKYVSVKAVWHGSRPHEEIPTYIAECDVMIHPTICLEAFGLTIAETLAVGRPVIATHCGGAEAQIRDGENGILVPPNDVEALRQAIQTVLNDPAKIRCMTNQAVRVISIEQHVNELEKVYRDTIDEFNKGMAN